MADLSDEDRQRFEAWASDDGTWPKAIERDATGQYKLSITAHSWTVWRAAIAADRALNAPQSAPTPSWVCAKCSTDRTKAPCPYGHSAALTGQCPMVGVAQAAPVAPAEPEAEREKGAPAGMVQIGWGVRASIDPPQASALWTARPAPDDIAFMESSGGVRVVVEPVYMAAAPHPATAGKD